MNDFVNYLNSTNNVGGDSTGSLAEKQVRSIYYDAIKVNRKLGQYIADCVRNGNHQAFILTGHAGDGKTSILVQVLKALDRLPAGAGLEIETEFDDFYYVKDMSEIAEGKQVDALEWAIQAPGSGKTSLLISNTGPLLKAFEDLVQSKRIQESKDFSREDRMGIRAKLLTQLDTNKDEELELEGFRFTLVNIARVDNVPFAVRIMERILEPQLWEPCNDCDCAGHCPIKNNQELIRSQFERVSAFVENFYRYLYENDKRMTIRQMVGQISYALTGNLTCGYIANHHLREPLFVYHFANLFFGFQGLREARDAAQIKGIQQIQNLALDRIALDEDYRLFVNQDYSCFLPAIQEELTALTRRDRKHYQITDEDHLSTEKRHQAELRFRRAVRRFYLLFSLEEFTENTEHILNQVFGPSYTDYQKLISHKQPKMMLTKMKNVVFEALYMKNTGAQPHGKSDLPLTLRRKDDVFQSVMIVLGQVGKSDLTVLQERVQNRFEDADEKYSLVLRLDGKDFPLSLPMIAYFNDLINGAISSNNNPALTHGIAQLDALLLEQFGEKPSGTEEDYELAVLINTSRGQEIKYFSIDGKRLTIQ